MSEFSFCDDISDMHWKFGVNAWVKKQVTAGNHELLYKFLKFRLDCINEELDETKDAFNMKDSEEVVDGLVDILVFTLGTLDVMGVNGTKAWKEVHKANISKKVGIKESRPNPFGLPDLVKPEGWEGPDHSSNTGFLDFIFRKEHHEDNS